MFLIDENRNLAHIILFNEFFFFKQNALNLQFSIVKFEFPAKNGFSIS